MRKTKMANVKLGCVMIKTSPQPLMSGVTLFLSA